MSQLVFYYILVFSSEKNPIISFDLDQFYLPHLIICFVYLFLLLPILMSFLCFSIYFNNRYSGDYIKNNIPKLKKCVSHEKDSETSSNQRYTSLRMTQVLFFSSTCSYFFCWRKGKNYFLRRWWQWPLPPLIFVRNIYFLKYH